MRTLLGALFVALLSCTPPAPVPPPTPTAPDCGVSTTASLTGRQGERLSLPLTIGADVTALRVEQLMSLSDSVENAELKVTLPYGLTTAKLVLAVDCDGRTSFTDFDFTILPSSWSRAAEWSGGAGPTAREYFSMWLDPNDSNRVYLHGGFIYVPQQFTPNDELWSLNLSTKTWRPVTQSGAKPSTAGGRMALSADGKSSLYFGGIDVVAMETPNVLARLSLETGAWTNEATTGGRGEYQPSFFFDAKRNRYLSICGANDTVSFHCDVRELKDGAWNTVTTTGTAPAGRNGHAWVYDSQTDRVILFGGDIRGSTQGDTWALDLVTSTWSRLFESSIGIQPRRNMAYALDVKNHRMIIWGGTSDGAHAVTGVQALDLTPGLEAWSQLGTDGTQPAPRASGAAVYDAKNQRLLMGFGNSLEGQYADLWELKL
ncbi:MAG: Kelch repeat-containing protein [Archangium sp.]